MSLVKSQRAKGLRKLALVEFGRNGVTFVLCFGVLGIFASLCIATWQLFTSSLDVGAKAAITGLVIWGPLILLGYYLAVRHKGLYALMRRRQRLRSGK